LHPEQSSRMNRKYRERVNLEVEDKDIEKKACCIYISLIDVIK